MKRTELPLPERGVEPALAEFQRIIRERPDDVAAAERLAHRLVAASTSTSSAKRCAEALASLTAVAEWREARGQQTEATALRATMQRLELAYLEAQLGFGSMEQGEPAARMRTPELLAQARRARVCVSRGDAVGAARHLTAEMAERDPLLLLAIGEIQLRGGRLDQGVDSIERAIAQDPGLAEEVVELGIEMAADQADAGFMLVVMATDVWMSQSKWQKATAAFEEFIRCNPDYAPAVARLREATASAVQASDDKVIPFRPPSPPLPKSRRA
jgi:tetratricopeptide (TPR) repeat protein